MRKNILKYVDLGSVGFANGISVILGGFFWLYLATILETEGYGQLSYILAFAGTAIVVSNLGSHITITVNTSKTGIIQPSLYILPIIVSIISSTLLFLINQSPFVIIYVVGSVITTLYLYTLLGLKSYKKYASAIIIEEILEIILAVSLYNILGIDGIILGIGIAHLIFAYPLYQYFKNNKINIPIIKSTKNLSLHSYSLFLSRTFALVSDKIIILPLVGYTAVGNYHLAMQILLLMNVIPLAVYQYILPHESTGKNNTKLKKFTILISIILSILGFFIVPNFISYFLPKFGSTIEILPTISLAIVPMTITLMYISKFLGVEKSKHVLISSILFTICYFVGIQFIIPEIGIIGAAYSIVLSYTLQSIYLIIANKIVFKSFI